MSQHNPNQGDRVGSTLRKRSPRRAGFRVGRPAPPAMTGVLGSALILACTAVIVTTATSCGPSEKPQLGEIPADSPQFLPVDIETKSFASIGRFFVPVYSDLAMGDGRHPLEVTLAINNVDVERPIVVSS